MDHLADYVCHSDGRVESPPPEEYAGDQPNDSGMSMPKPRGGIVGSQIIGT